MPYKYTSVHKCPDGCGWTRTYNRETEWMKSKLRHPVYGYISQDVLLALDIRHHDCAEHLAAHARAVTARANRE